jgi:hypothetical protein
MFDAIVVEYSVVSPVVLANRIENAAGVLCNWRDVRGGEAFRLWVMDDITAEQNAIICSICACYIK